MTWSQVYLDQALITPCCQGSLVRFSRTTDDYAKNRLLFSNPAHTSKRVNLPFASATTRERAGLFPERSTRARRPTPLSACSPMIG